MASARIRLRTAPRRGQHGKRSLNPDLRFRSRSVKKSEKKKRRRFRANWNYLLPAAPGAMAYTIQGRWAEVNLFPRLQQGGEPARLKCARLPPRAPPLAEPFSSPKLRWARATTRSSATGRGARCPTWWRRAVQAVGQPGARSRRRRRTTASSRARHARHAADGGALDHTLRGVRRRTSSPRRRSACVTAEGRAQALLDARDSPRRRRRHRRASSTRRRAGSTTRSWSPSRPTSAAGDVTWTCTTSRGRATGSGGRSTTSCRGRSSSSDRGRRVRHVHQRGLQAALEAGRDYSFSRPSAST